MKRLLKYYIFFYTVLYSFFTMMTQTYLPLKMPIVVGGSLFFTTIAFGFIKMSEKLERSL